MHRIRTLAVATAATLGVAAAVVAGPTRSAGAAGDPVIGMQVLDLLCASKGGAPVFTPYHISRCQDARTRDGFQIEQLVCEGLLEGSFEVVGSTSRPHRVNWFCFAGEVQA